MTIPLRRWIIVSLILAIVIAGIAASVVPVKARAERYRPIDSTRSEDELVRRSPAWTFEPAPDFIIDEGRLYLLFQTQRSALFLNKRITTMRWTTRELQAFRDLHPELEHYWPHPDEADGGVSWIQPDSG